LFTIVLKLSATFFGRKTIFKRKYIRPKHVADNFNKIVNNYSKSVALDGNPEPELRRIFGPKRDEVTGEWRKLHSEELHDLYFSSSIIRIMKARRTRWAGHVARMGRGGTRVGCWWESQREGGH
jgi:hypothetical protein